MSRLRATGCREQAQQPPQPQVVVVGAQHRIDGVDAQARGKRALVEHRLAEPRKARVQSAECNECLAPDRRVRTEREVAVPLRARS